MYDRAIPPVEAVELLADALARLSETAAVVLTPGNHDSAVRLGFGAALMRPGVHLRARRGAGRHAGAARRRRGARGGHPLPYLDPDAVRDVLGDGEPTGPLARGRDGRGDGAGPGATSRAGAGVARRW